MESHQHRATKSLKNYSPTTDIHRKTSMTLYEEEYAFMSENKVKTEEPSITLYDKNTISTAYNKDEKAIKKIICSNVTPTSVDTKLNLVIYYKSRKTANLVMKNSCLPPVTPLHQVNVY
ncbi:hypothetical protein E2C01_021848 [Portunus trituberculatus]|uniref:Uncharacterized protein n=1 Tax=Portunus trituberculatus TaxID=210409 RepID=A0A5B7E5F9_PORTR|nr:hypothetical protein [Portunus trituberculatus]